jgi:PAS domain S-box-containing protein
MEHRPGISENTRTFLSPLSENEIFDLIPQAICVFDMDGLIRKYNERAIELWGRRPDLSTGKERFSGALTLYTTEEILLPHDESPVAACIKSGLTQKDIELIMERPDRSQLTVRMNVAPIVDDQGRQTGVINCFQDISDIKRTEQALRESEAKYRRLAGALEKEIEKKVRDLKEKTEELKLSEQRYHKMIEEVEDYAIILLDKEGIVQNWNKGAEKIKGYKEEDIVGKSFINFYLQEDREKGLPLLLIREAADNGKAEYEGWRRRKDGTTFWGSIVLTAIHDDENNIIGFSKVTRDLTERKLAEDRTKEYLSQLEFQNRELEQFVYAASHDLKEPLRKIQIYNNFVIDSSADTLNVKSRDYMNRSIKAADRMKDLIENLLIYSRSTSVVDNVELVDLNKLMAEVAGQFKEEFERGGAKIEIGPLPVIRAVAFQIKQLFHNLIDNALKYKHSGREVVIMINAEIVAGNEIKGNLIDPAIRYHKISVADNGIGFESRYAAKIFEVFQRLTNSSEIAGSGIGLAICKKIVQNHKGYIEATGVPMKGATFYVYLPLV